MKLLSLAVFSALSYSAASQEAASNCPTGYFGESCNMACSDGCGEASCGPDGVCNNASEKDFACTKGWQSSNNDNKCAIPLCFGAPDGCAENGECVAPNHCICGKSGAQVVSKFFDEDANKGQEKGWDCVSLRKDGLMGAGVALAVMAVSVTTCGVIAEKRGQAK